MTPWVLQEAIHARLVGTAEIIAFTGDRIYDHTPQDPTYPFIVVGDDTVIPWDTKTETGSENTVTIHTWSEYRGRKEIKQIQRQIDIALNRYALVVAGVDTINVELEFAETFVDPDGIRRHGVQRFRILLDEG